MTIQQHILACYAVILIGIGTAQAGISAQPGLPGAIQSRARRRR
jgi:hypothetical protein